MEFDRELERQDGQKKFCRDCKWVDKEAGEEKVINWLCTSPDLKPRFNLVSGEQTRQYCQDVRLGDKCGIEGKLWEPLSEGPY